MKNTRIRTIWNVAFVGKDRTGWQTKAPRNYWCLSASALDAIKSARRLAARDLISPSLKTVELVGTIDN